MTHVNEAGLSTRRLCGASAGTWTLVILLHKFLPAIGLLLCWDFGHCSTILVRSIVADPLQTWHSSCDDSRGTLGALCLLWNADRDGTGVGVDRIGTELSSVFKASRVNKQWICRTSDPMLDVLQNYGNCERRLE
ncbi:hypothetical protein CBR_g3711 [Chara braunii]|uniref:Uncharacterized protein n=1 Tax=Chara braunii TaxID=69332 RepID=A0A388KG43_CHABU|nr:hypothetical protein CBR_g3711 [Chara braunii]|eukprot:GBG69011.1 hypothetical protein CBR_g3711 [Chara braunii]